MKSFLFGAWLPWVGLTAGLWIIEYRGERYWIDSIWSLPRLDYFDVPWLVVLLLILPVAAAWAGVELLRLLRRPRLFDSRATSSPMHRALFGCINGVMSVALFSLLTAYQTEIPLPDVGGVILSVALTAVSLGLLLPRLKPGRCIVCDYDTGHLPFPARPALRRCPECGAEVA